MKEDILGSEILQLESITTFFIEQLNGYSVDKKPTADITCDETASLETGSVGSHILQGVNKCSPEERWSWPSRYRASFAARPVPAWTSWSWSGAGCNWLLWWMSCLLMTRPYLWHSAAETAVSTNMAQQSFERVIKGTASPPSNKKRHHSLPVK